MKTQTVVLIVEDEPLIALDLESQLLAAGAIPIVCRSLAEAERALTRCTCQGAVIDLSLPDGDAIPLATRLGASGIRVVIYSGLDIAPSLGCIFLRKPAAPGRVAAAILARRHDGEADP